MKLLCTKCKCVIEPHQECLLDDNDREVHAVCPTDLFGDPVKPAHSTSRGGLFDSLGLDSDKGAW